MKPVRLLVCDLDGTLLPFDGDPAPPRRFAAFWRDLPDQVRPRLCYNSGRLADDLGAAVAAAGLPAGDFLVSGIGTRIADGEGRALRSWQAHLASDGWRRHAVEAVAASLPGIVRQSERYQDDFKSSWWLPDAEPALLTELRRRLDEAGLRTTIIYSSDRDLDILPQHADKGQAIRFLCHRLEIGCDEVAVAGDTGNDIAMFTLPQVRGILVANARHELIAALADRPGIHRCQAAAADGVVEALRAFGLAPEPPDELACIDRNSPSEVGR